MKKPNNFGDFVRSKKAVPKYKFEEKVKITSNDFYHGAAGLVLSFDDIDERYEVLLAHGCRRWFLEKNLNKVGKK